MKNDDLLNLIGKVDDKYIAELYEEDLPHETAGAKHGGTWKRIAALAACLALVIAGGAGIYLGSGKRAPEVSPSPTPTPAAAMSIVVMDVNPSIQLTVQPDGTVNAVTPLNDDAKALLQNESLSGAGCAQVMKKLVSALEADGYLSNMKNSVLLTVVGDDDAENQAVLTKVTAAMEYACADNDYELSILSQVADGDEYAAKAEEYGISIGKAALIEKMVGGMEDYDFKELSGLNIHALDQIMDYIGSESVRRTGKVAGALTDRVSSELGINGLDAKEAIDLAVALSDAYNELCKADPDIDTETYTGYDFRLEQGAASDGSKIWTIVAESKADASLPSVSVRLGDGLSILHKYGKAVMDDSLRLVCDIFDLPRIMRGG